MEVKVIEVNGQIPSDFKQMRSDQSEHLHCWFLFSNFSSQGTGEGAGFIFTLCNF